MPLAHFQHFCLEERARIERCTIALREVFEQRRTAGDAARFQQRSAHGDVVGRLFEALRDGAHAAAEFQSQIPREADKPLDARLQMSYRLIRQQHEDVDVRMRRELPAPIPADGQQRKGGGHVAGVPCSTQRLVSGACERAHQRFHVGGQLEAFQQLGFGHLVVRLERRGIGKGNGWNTAHGRARMGTQGHQAVVADATSAGRAGVPADIVSTS
jgi:hypothetical protein